MTKQLFLATLLLTVSVGAGADEADNKLQTDGVRDAYNLVIRECNNVASQSDIRFMRAMSNKSWTEKEKAQVLATTHNGLLQLCLLGIADELKKKADSLNVLIDE